MQQQQQQQQRTIYCYKIHLIAASTWGGKFVPWTQLKRGWVYIRARIKCIETGNKDERPIQFGRFLWMDVNKKRKEEKTKRVLSLFIYSFVSANYAHHHLNFLLLRCWFQIFFQHESAWKSLNDTNAAYIQSADHYLLQFSWPSLCSCYVKGVRPNRTTRTALSHPHRHLLSSAGLPFPFSFDF